MAAASLQSLPTFADAGAREERLKTVNDLGERTQRELGQFLVAAGALDEKNARLLGWGGPDDAMGILRRSLAAGG